MLSSIEVEVYWLNGPIELQNEYVCCLDYSTGKKDRLAAYNYDGENSLLHSKYSCAL